MPTAECLCHLGCKALRHCAQEHKQIHSCTTTDVNKCISSQQSLDGGPARLPQGSVLAVVVCHGRLGLVFVRALPVHVTCAPSSAPITARSPPAASTLCTADLLGLKEYDSVGYEMITLWSHLKTSEASIKCVAQCDACLQGSVYASSCCVCSGIAGPDNGIQ